MPELEPDEQETVVETPEVEAEEPVEEAEPEGEEAEPEAEEGEEEAPAPTRGERRQQKLANELKQEREARIRAETRAEEAARTRQPQVNSEEAQRREEEKLALMDPQERRDYQRDKEMKEMRNQVAMTQFQTKDALDKAAFREKALTSKAAKRLEGKVEEEYQKALRNGNFVPRASLFAYLRGVELEEIESRPPSKQTQAAKKAAAERVESVKGKAMSSKSDVSRSKNDPDSIEALQERIAAEEKRRGLR